MTFHPLSLIGGTATDPAQATLDYSRYGDDQLMAERERRQRQLDELTHHGAGEAATCSLMVSLDDEIERITGELIRRARSRHPSSFNPAS